MSLLRLRGSVQLPVVGPNVAWTGTASSPPSDVLRTTAKPVGHWVQAGECVLTGDLIIGAVADAVGGIYNVQLFGDCATTNGVFGVRTITTADGRTRRMAAWWWTISQAQFMAVTTTGKARFFARITPNDSSMQDRIIGLDSISGGGVFRTDWAMTVYPRSGFDFDKTVGPSGRDYTTIAAAFNAARTANAKCVRLSLDGGVNHEALDGNSGTTGTSNATGLAVIRTAPGAGSQAVIRRASAYDPGGSDTVGSWRWRPGWHGIEFQNVTLDTANWTSICSNAKCSFNGVLLTDSSVSSSNYLTNWMKSYRPAFKVYPDSGSFGGADISGWWIDSTILYQCEATSFSYCAIGVNIRYAIGTPGANCCFWADAYLADCDTSPPTVTRNVLTITGPAGATIDCDGGVGDAGTETPGTRMILKVSGTTVATYTYTSASNGADATHTFDPGDLAAKINALGGGWGATVLDNTLASRWILPTGTVHAAGSPQDTAIGAGITLSLRAPYHTEVYHSVSNSDWMENVHIVNMRARRTYWSSFIFDFEHHNRDVMVKNVAFPEATPQGTMVLSSQDMSNCNFIHCNIAGIIAVDSNVASDAYSGIRYCNFGNWDSVQGDVAPPTYPLITFSKFGKFWARDLPVDATHHDNFPTTDPWGGGNPHPVFEATWTDYANGDYRPAGTALTDLVTILPENSLDIDYMPRAATDALGPMRKGVATAPSYPF